MTMVHKSCLYLSLITVAFETVRFAGGFSPHTARFGLLLSKNRKSGKSVLVKRLGAAVLGDGIPSTTEVFQSRRNSLSRQEQVPCKLIVHWKGEDVEGYSIQFRFLEFWGSLAAVTGLPLDEVKATVHFNDALNYTGSTDNMPHIKMVRFNQAMQYVKVSGSNSSLPTSAIPRRAFVEATRRSSLVHAVYETVAEGSDYESVSSLAQSNSGFEDMYVGGEQDSSTWCLRVRHFGSSSVPSKERRYGERRTRSTSKEQEALLALKPMLLEFGGGVDLKFPDEKIYIFEGLNDAEVTLARRMATGPRISTIAPATRICVTNTPLCPIAAFTMCNVAGIRGGKIDSKQAVLDPYAGSGAILLAAAMIEPSCRAVGIEIAHDGLVNRDDIRLDFSTRNLPQPVALLEGDSTKESVRAEARAAIGDEPFDYIITDPPYGIRESNLDTKPVDELMRFIASDRNAGRRILKKGGKLVCFLPCQFDEQFSVDAMPDTDLMEEAGLALEAAREQPLNSKLSRWLVSFICIR